MSKHKDTKSNTYNKPINPSKPIKKNTAVDLKPRAQPPVVQTKNEGAKEFPIFKLDPIKKNTAVDLKPRAQPPVVQTKNEGAMGFPISKLDPIKKNTAGGLKSRDYQAWLEWEEWKAKEAKEAAALRALWDADTITPGSFRLFPEPPAAEEVDDDMPDWVDDPKLWQAEPPVQKKSAAEIKKAYHDAKVWFGLIPDPALAKSSQKKGAPNKNWNKKPWKQNKKGAWKPKAWAANRRPFKRKFDKFALQKRWLKELYGMHPGLVSNQYTDYLGARGTRRKVNRGVAFSAVSGLKFKVLPQTRYFNTNRAGTELDLLSSEDLFFTKTSFNRNVAKQLASIVELKKQPLTLYDKVFYYYTLQTPLTMYAHKAFILLEMQLNATLVRAKLVPYLFLVRDLCFYRLVQVNLSIAKNPHQVISLYDSVSIPVYLHNYMYYRQYRIQYYPQNIGNFFKQYWAHFTNYTNNKVWLLSNFLTSDITAETVLFDYPNITLYMGPFKRFTKLYYKNHPYAPTSAYRHLNHTHTVLKLKLFEYAAFYR